MGPLGGPGAALAGVAGALLAPGLLAANKIEIAKAIEEIFGVKVAKVNTLNMQGKEKVTTPGMFRADRTTFLSRSGVTTTGLAASREFRKLCMALVTRRRLPPATNKERRD